MKTLAFALMASIAIPAFGQKSLSYSDAEAMIRSYQPSAKGIGPVDGAIVCPSYQEAAWLYRMISEARMTRMYVPQDAQRQAILIDGYDRSQEPNPADYRCEIVPSGTRMNVEWKGGIPIVSGTLPDGRPFAGVTLYDMVSR